MKAGTCTEFCQGGVSIEKKTKGETVCYKKIGGDFLSEFLSSFIAKGRYNFMEEEFFEWLVEINSWRGIFWVTRWNNFMGEESFEWLDENLR